MKLSHHENLLGGVYMHLLRSPNGPSLTFRVTEYCLAKDVFNLVHKMFDNRQFSKPPLLAMTGFSGPMSANGVKEPPPPHARLVVDMFQNMLPSLNVQKVRLRFILCLYVQQFGPPYTSEHERWQNTNSCVQGWLKVKCNCMVSM